MSQLDKVGESGEIKNGITSDQNGGGLWVLQVFDKSEFVFAQHVFIYQSSVSQVLQLQFIQGILGNATTTQL